MAKSEDVVYNVQISNAQHR